MLPELDDADFEKYVSDLKHGNGQDFKPIYEALFEPACYFAYRLTGNEATAEDIVHESFVKLWYQRKSLNSYNELKAFLYTTVKNKCLNYLRDKQIHTEAHREIAASLPLSDQSIENNVIWAEIMAMVWQEIHGLPPGCKQVCKLLLQEGLTSKEIAARLGMSAQSVDSQIRRAAKLLKTAFLRKQMLPFIAIFFRFFS